MTFVTAACSSNRPRQAELGPALSYFATPHSKIRKLNQKQNVIPLLSSYNSSGRYQEVAHYLLNNSLPLGFALEVQ
jgi:hypothetical protein